MIILREAFPQEIKMVAKDGRNISLQKTEPLAFCRWLGTIFPKIKNAQDKFISLNIVDENGKKLGDIHLDYIPEKNFLNVGWIGVRKGDRGNGIARIVLEKVIEFAKSQGYDSVVLEAVKSGHAQDLYKSLGFKYSNWDGGDDHWNDIDLMELKLKK